MSGSTVKLDTESLAEMVRFADPTHSITSDHNWSVERGRRGLKVVLHAQDAGNAAPSLAWVAESIETLMYSNGCSNDRHVSCAAEYNSDWGGFSLEITFAGVKAAMILGKALMVAAGAAEAERLGLVA